MADMVDSKEVSAQSEVEETSEREVDIRDIASGIQQWADSGVKFGDIMRATGKEFFVNRPKAKVEAHADAMREAAAQRAEARQVRAAERQEAAEQRRAARAERIQGFRDRVRASISRAADKVTAGPRAAYSAAASMLNVPVAATMRLTGAMSERAHGGMDVLRNFSSAVSQRAQAFGKGVSETVGVARERGMLAGAGYGLSRAGMGIARGAMSVGSSVARRLGDGYAAFKENHAEDIADFKRNVNAFKSDVATRKDMFVSDHLTGYARAQKGRSIVSSLLSRATGFIGRKFSAMSEGLGRVPEAAEQAVERHASQRSTFKDASERLEDLSDSELVALSRLAERPDVSENDVARARESGKSVFSVGSVEVAKALDEFVARDGARRGEFEAMVEDVARDRYGDDKVDLMVRTASEFGHEGVSVADAVRLCETDKAMSSVYSADAHDLDEARALEGEALADRGKTVDADVEVVSEEGELGDDVILFEADEPGVEPVEVSHEDVLPSMAMSASEADREWVEGAVPVDEDEMYRVNYAEDFEAEMSDDEDFDVKGEAPVFKNGSEGSKSGKSAYNPYDE